MAGYIYVIMTGNENNLWSRCLKDDVVALEFGAAYYDAWRTGDYDAYLAVARAIAGQDETETEIKGRATLWFNRGNDLTSSEGDLFFHRDRQTDRLYWAETTAAAPVFEQYADDRVMLAKPVTKWLHHDRQQKPLTWSSIHPIAKNYLASQAAMFKVGNADMQAYLRVMVDGNDLSPWHARQHWKERLGENKALGASVSLHELMLANLMLSITETVKNANGQRVFKTLKNKELQCSEQEMKAHLASLYEIQGGKCAVTGLTMHLRGQDNSDKDMLVSPDRIDSCGHYTIGNLQLVCQFINFWKMAQDNDRFAELLDLVVAKRLTDT